MKMLRGWLFLFSLNLSCFALAQDETNDETNIDKKQDNQKQRIEQGLDSGELTKHEAKHMKHEQMKINKMEKHANQDGTVSKKEKVRIHKAQSKASKDIYRKKHNKRSKR